MHWQVIYKEGHLGAPRTRGDARFAHMDAMCRHVDCHVRHRACEAVGRPCRACEAAWVVSCAEHREALPACR